MDMVQGRKRIVLDRDIYTWTRDLLGQENVDGAELTPQMAVSAALLGSQGFHGDPADRFLYATARELGVPFVTKDASIRDFARAARDVKTVW
jgi:PIN domain nuclease of toxin-antitoxin system